MHETSSIPTVNIPAVLSLKTPLFFLEDKAPGQKIAYAPLRRIAFRVNPAGEKLLRILKAGAPESAFNAGQQAFINTLNKMGLFEQRNDEPEKVSALEHHSYQPTSVSLFLTGKCNLHCSYCYARGGDTDTLMPWEIAKAALDFIIQNATETNTSKIQVIFHGDGEPTLAWPLMQQCIEYTEFRCAEENLEYAFEAGMNGIISEKRLRIIAPKLSNLTVSIDGPPEIQDAQRPLASAKGHARAQDLKSGIALDNEESSSSKIVERSLKILDELEVPYGVRVTVTEKSVQQLPEVVKYICEVSKARMIQLEPIFPVGRALETGDQAVDPEIFTRGFLQARMVARQYGRMLAYSGARADQITNRFCEAISGAFNITQDGRITSCYEVFEKGDSRMEHFGIGYYDQSSGLFKVNLEKVRAAAKWTAQEKKPCQDCFAKYHCAGDCSAKTSAIGHPEDTVNPNKCYVIREITRAQIFSLYGLGEIEAPSMGWKYLPIPAISKSEMAFPLPVIGNLSVV